MIVIVIIAILASITVVAYNGIQNKAKDAAQLSAFDAIEKALRIYKAANGSYPQFSDAAPGTSSSIACIGSYPATSNFPNASNGQGSCYANGSTVFFASSAQLNTALQTVINTVPNNSSTVSDLGGGSYFRGFLYELQQDGSVILEYVVPGTNQSCGRGTPMAFGANTDCQLALT